MIKSKQGMGVSQVFIFIIAALTFALIMIFEYKIISEFLQRGEQVEFVQFKNELEGSIKKIYTEYGSTRLKEFNSPAKYTQICFVDMSKEYDPRLCPLDPVACTVWENTAAGGGYDQVDENVFLTPPAPVKIKVYQIHLNLPTDQNFLCLPIVNGRFSMVLEGKGDHTQISDRE